MCKKSSNDKKYSVLYVHDLIQPQKVTRLLILPEECYQYSKAVKFTKQKPRRLVTYV